MAQVQLPVQSGEADPDRHVVEGDRGSVGLPRLRMQMSAIQYLTTPTIVAALRAADRLQKRARWHRENSVHVSSPTRLVVLDRIRIYSLLA